MENIRGSVMIHDEVPISLELLEKAINAVAAYAAENRKDLSKPFTQLDEDLADLQHDLELAAGYNWDK